MMLVVVKKNTKNSQSQTAFGLPLSFRYSVLGNIQGKHFKCSPCPCALPKVTLGTQSQGPHPSTTTLMFCSDMRQKLGYLFNLLHTFLRSSNEKHYFMLHCFPPQYFTKCIIPSHTLFEAKKLICHSEIHLVWLRSAMLGSRTYIIYWEGLQLLSYRFRLRTDAAGMMSVKCWVGLSLSSSSTPVSAFL